MARIAYDIGILGTYFSRPDCKTGIYRVTEELLYSLINASSINVGLVNCCGEPSAFGTFGSEAYARTDQKLLSRYDCSYKSVIGLETAYKRLFSTYFDKNFQKLPKYSFSSFLVRGGMKVLNWSRLEKLDFKQIFDVKEYDLLHSTYLKLPDKEITQRLPRLLMIHDLIPLMASQFVASNVDTYFLKILDSIDHTTDWVVCNSNYTRQEFCDYTGFPAEKTFITYLAADSQFCQVKDPRRIEEIKNRYGIGEQPFFLCLASQLEPRKNILHLVKAFLTLVRETPSFNAKLFLAGSLRYEREDLQQARKLSGFSEHVVLVGYVPDDDLVALYNAAIGFVFPSLYEGFGMPVLEAMQSGCPVITSNVTSLPEIVDDAAILIDPKDEDALCQAMLNLFRDSSLRRTFTNKGLNRAQQFGWNRCASETSKIYDKILS
jgi:glycosyltransferase involved in cell wall biosynthesis